MAPVAGFEPATYWLTANCSTAELHRNIYKTRVNFVLLKLFVAANSHEWGNLNDVVPFNFAHSLLLFLEQKMGVEPTTFSLQVRYTANCVTPANLYLLYHVYCLLSSGFDNSNITMFRPSSYIIITPQYSINEKISLSL